MMARVGKHVTSLISHDLVLDGTALVDDCGCGDGPADAS